MKLLKGSGGPPGGGDGAISGVMGSVEGLPCRWEGRGVRGGEHRRELSSHNTSWQLMTGLWR